MPVRRAEQEPVEGSKSGVGQSIAELVLTGVLPGAAVTAVYKVITAYRKRAKARSVTWVQDGEEVELTALSGKEQRRMIELLVARKAAPPPSDDEQK